MADQVEREKTMQQVRDKAVLISNRFGDQPYLADSEDFRWLLATIVQLADIIELGDDIDSRSGQPIRPRDCSFPGQHPPHVWFGAVGTFNCPGRG